MTGGTGQIGKYLCTELADRGNNVLCYDTRADSFPASRVRAIVGDVTDFARLSEVSKKNSIDCVVHLAASLVLESKEHPAQGYRTNIIGTNNIMEVGRLLDLKKIVIASSVVVYGASETRRPVDEDDYLDVPPDPYSTSKAACELMGRYYSETYELTVTCLRLAGAWGPGRYTGYTGQFNEFLRRAALGETVSVPDDFAYREAKLRWMYVKDVGRCFADTAESSKTKSYLYNTGAKEPFSSIDVVDALRSVLPDGKIGIKLRSKPTETSETVPGPNGLDVDCRRLYRELQFKPAFDLKGAVKDMVTFERSKSNLQAAP